MAIFLGLSVGRGAHHRASQPSSHARGLFRGTVMRNDRPPLAAPGPVLALTSCTAKSTGGGRSITLASRLRARPTGRFRASLLAVPIPAIALPADHHHVPAPGTVVPSMALLFLTPIHIAAARGWT